MQNQEEKKVTIYTNGRSLFTLNNYSPAAGVSFPNGITFHSEVDLMRARVMHSKGQLHYISGIGDRKELSGIKLRRNLKLNNFKIN